jgi:hypothetical protein
MEDTVEVGFIAGKHCFDDNFESIQNPFHLRMHMESIGVTAAHPLFLDLL